jgi:gamma-glutamyltranspeptidase/glutathione hydrolase
VVAHAEQIGGGREGELRAARDAWYSGFVAEAVVAHCQGEPSLDSSGERHRGLLDGDDFASWEATVEGPATFDFGRHTICKTGPWGQGPVFLQQLALLEALGIRDVAYGSAEYLHLLVDAGKLAFADREDWYGDTGEVPTWSTTCWTRTTTAPGPPWWGRRRAPTYDRARSPAAPRSSGSRGRRAHGGSRRG